MAVTLISSSIVAGVDAKPSPIFSPDDICIGAGNRCYCSNDTANLTAECCVDNRSNGVTCETCDIDTETGDYVNCVITTGFTKGGSNLPGAPHHGAALGSDQQNPPGTVMIFNPPNNAKTFVNSNTSK